MLLIDLRGHGADATIAGPHTVAAAARDVAATVAHACGPDAPTPSEPTALLADGTAPLVLGHSFGGKVGLAYAAAAPRAADTDLALRLEPHDHHGRGRRRRGPGDPRGRGAGPGLCHDEGRRRGSRRKRGLQPATAQWLAMTTEKADDGGVRFSYDLDAVRALYDDHCQTDLLPEARALDDADRLGLVIAGKADVVPRDLGLNRTYVLAESGHNVHVDAPSCSTSSWGRTARTGCG